MSVRGTLDEIQRASMKEKVCPENALSAETEPRFTTWIFHSERHSTCSVNISDKIHMSYRITQDVGLTLWYHNRTHVSRVIKRIVSLISIDVTVKADAIYFYSLHTVMFYLAQREEK